MNTIKLIKKGAVSESVSAQNQSATSGTNRQRAVNVVKSWVQEYRSLQEQKMQAVFTHPFAQPRS